MRYLIIVSFILISVNVLAQDDSLAVEPLKLIFPEGNSWRTGVEEKDMSFKINANKHDSLLTYSFQAPGGLGMKMDSAGSFSWSPATDVVTAQEKIKSFYVMFRATDGVERDSAYVEFIITDKPEPVVPKSQLPKISAIDFPIRGNWKLLHEGDTLAFQLRAKTNNGKQGGIIYQIEEGEKSTITMDSLGNFFWIPDYDFVDRFQQVREKHLFFIAEDSWGNVVSEKVVLSVFHRNRRPKIENIPPFYVLSGTKNTYKLNTQNVHDPDGDPIVFVRDEEHLPAGMEFSSTGKISWAPSRSQFTNLRKDPIRVPFYVEDQPAKERTEGFILVEASHLDMPPEITVVPSDTVFSIDENERLHLVFHLSDPNGDDDVESFGFVSDDPRLTTELLRKNTRTQYEFLWTPGYDFVNDPDLFLEFDLRFFVLDKSRKTKERGITIKVNDTEDLAKKDAENYELYKSTLYELLNFMDHLAENQKNLEKELKLAKRGKKNRAIVSATIGAITGLSPVISQDDTQKTISVIGGTSTLTLGTLEAREVIGRSVNAINNKIKINTDLYNQFLSEGTSFSRRYNSKLNRRNKNFSYDLEKIKKMVNDPRIAQLELDGSWENKKKVNDRRLKSTFTDYDIMDIDD